MLAIEPYMYIIGPLCIHHRASSQLEVVVDMVLAIDDERGDKLTAVWNDAFATELR